MDYSEIVEVKEIWGDKDTSLYLKQGNWVLLAVATGTIEDEPCIRYSLGRKESLKSLPENSAK